MSYVEKAFEEVEKFPSKIVFLGVPPSDPESEYGYILPDYQTLEIKSQARSVKAFLEKPNAELAKKSVALGALWNTMVMVFRPEVLLQLVRMSLPLLHRNFQSIFKVLDTPLEAQFIEKIYRHMTPINLSKSAKEFGAHSSLWRFYGKAASRNRICNNSGRSHCFGRGIASNKPRAHLS